MGAAVRLGGEVMSEQAGGLLLMVYALFRGLSRDELILYRIKQRFRTEEEARAHTAEETVDEKAD